MMNARKTINLIIAIVFMASLLFAGGSQALAATRLGMPASATDETKVPHYFGPYSNYANSPFTLPDVAVDITGDGSGATAVATIGGNGAITGINITNPGIGYTNAGVNITSSN